MHRSTAYEHRHSRRFRRWSRIARIGVIVFVVGLLFGLPAWAALAAALLPVMFLVSLVRQQLRLDRLMASRHCPGCGYDLRASPGRCPECGKIFIDFTRWK